MNLKTISKLAMLVVIMSSCAINKKAYRNANEIAVISFNSSDKVTNQSSLQARLLGGVRIEDTVLTAPGEKVKNGMYKNLSKKFLRKLANENEIISDNAFKRYAEQNDNKLDGFNKLITLGVGYEAAEGYPVILPMQKEVMKESFASLPPEVDAVMVISSFLQFAEDATYNIAGISTAGLGKQRVRSTLHVYIINRSGKKVLNKQFIGESAEKLGDVDDEHSLDEVVDQAILDSFVKLERYLKKKVG